MQALDALKWSTLCIINTIIHFQCIHGGHAIYSSFKLGEANLQFVYKKAVISFSKAFKRVLGARPFLHIYAVLALFKILSAIRISASDTKQEKLLVRSSLFYPS